MGFISRHSRLRGNKDLDSCSVFQRGKLKTAGMSKCHSHNRTRLLARLQYQVSLARQNAHVRASKVKTRTCVEKMLAC